MTTVRGQAARAALVVLAFAFGAACDGPSRNAGGEGDQGGDGGSGDQGGGGGAGGGVGGAGGGADMPKGGGPFSGEYSDPSAPANPSGAFGGPANSDSGARPVVVYPLSRSMLGKNLGGMNIQWRAGAGNTIFRVVVKGAKGEAQLYAGAAACPGGKCQLKVPDAFWAMIANANAGATVTLVVSGVPAAGGAVAKSADISVDFSPEDIRGGLYYWSSALPGTMRVKLGDSTPEPFIKPGSAANPGKCVGCHTLTRDGCRIALTYEGGDGHLGIIDVKDPTKLYIDPKKEFSNFQSWNPDGTRLITVKDGTLILRDNVGTLVSKVPAASVGPAGVQRATHPEWSADGKFIAFTRLADNAVKVVDWIASGDIMLISAENEAFATPAKVLVPHTAKEYSYYPHFSPDSKWVVFNTGTMPGKSPAKVDAANLPSYDQTSSRLRLVPVSGGTPVELVNATQGKDTSASWPKFSPFTQAGGNIMFIVFSSRIDYGFVVEQATITPVSPGLYGRPQMWVSAIDVSRKGDPSYPPFWLSFQESSEGNHLGYWTTRIPGGTVAGGDCP